MSRTIKNKLKTNIVAVARNHSINHNNDEINQFKMSILAGISATLMHNDTQVRPVKNGSEFINTYTKELEFIDKHFKTLGFRINVDLLHNQAILELINIVINEIMEGKIVDDDLLAWMYQYFNIGSSSNHLSNTQFFTEKYMIQYLVDQNWNESCVNFKIIDPACGGGNFIIYIFNKMINSLSENSETITLKDIESTLDRLYGYDIDPNLSVLTSLGLKIVIIRLLRQNGKFDLEILNGLQTNIFISETQNIIGSLDVTSDDHILVNVEQTKKTNMKKLMADQAYDFVFTNPPFQGIKGMDRDLREYLKVHYPSSKGDLCNAFIERALSILNTNGKCGLVTQTSWMFLDSYATLRENIIKHYHINNIVDLGSNSFMDLSGEKSNVALVSFVNSNPNHNTVTSVLRLKYYSKKEKPEVLISKRYKASQVFEVRQDLFLKNYMYTIEYLSIGKIKAAFEKLPPYREFGTPMQGTSTGDNSKFIDYHWKKDSKDWLLVSKGGSYCKWNGLNNYKVLWLNNGEDIKDHPSSALRNIKYFDRTDLVYSDTGTSGLGVRLLKENQMFIASGPGIRDLKGNKYSHLALLNSRLFSYFIRILSPKLTIAAGYIASIPTVETLLYSDDLREIGLKCSDLKDNSLKNIIISYEFQHQDYSKLEIDIAVENNLILHMKNELLRLELERDLESIVMTAYGFDQNEIEHIYEEVGYCAMDTVKERDLPKVEWLDKYFSNALTSACEVSITKIEKHHLGIEGILEALAIGYGYSPYIIYSYIIEHVNEFTLTKEIFFKDYIHKLILYFAGYRNPAISSMKNLTLDHMFKIIFDDYKILDISNSIKLKKWIVEEFNEWHTEAFKNSPIIKFDHNSIGFLLLNDSGGSSSGK